jgi:hypothetical protein
MKKIALVVMAVLVVAFLAGCPWPYGDLRPYVGRWENSDYTGQPGNDVVEFYDNDSGVIYWEPPYACPDCDTFEADLDKEWYDNDNNYYAQMRLYYASDPNNPWYYLFRVSADGQTFELNGHQAPGYLDEIDTTPSGDYVYGIWYLVP